MNPNRAMIIVSAVIVFISLGFKNPGVSKVELHGTEAATGIRVMEIITPLS